MKGLKVKVNMDLVNTVLLVVILALVVYCLVKQNERFADHEGAINTDVLEVFKKYRNALEMANAVTNNNSANTNSNANNANNAAMINAMNNAAMTNAVMNNAVMN